jgi:hypothetical protein
LITRLDDEKRQIQKKTIHLRALPRVYFELMQRISAALLLIACCALIGSQLSGVHAHVDDHGFAGAVQSTHGHHHDHGDEHDGDADVQVLDLGMSAAKAVFLLFALAVTLFLLPAVRGPVRFEHEIRLPLRRRLRWRPPLRAPPFSISIA